MKQKDGVNLRDGKKGTDQIMKKKKEKKIASSL